MSFLIIFFTAFLASIIAFLSGFGFLTLVMPVLAIFLHIPLAIAVTALAHFFHLIVKLGFTYKSINYKIALSFGAIAMISSIPGTYFLQYISDLPPYLTYHLGSFVVQMTYLKTTVGVILLFAILTEKSRLQFLKFKSLIPSAVVSGFVGGLTGTQGAFRSLYLLTLNMKKKTFVATGAAISLVVDVIRIIFYYNLFPSWQMFLPDVLPALIGATIGSFIGMFTLKRLQMHHIHTIVLILLYSCGLAFLLGFL